MLLVEANVSFVPSQIVPMPFGRGAGEVWGERAGF